MPPNSIVDTYTFSQLPLIKVVAVLGFETPKPQDPSGLLKAYEFLTAKEYGLFSLEAGVNRNLVQMTAGGGRGLVMINQPRAMQSEIREDACLTQYHKLENSSYAGFQALANDLYELLQFNSNDIFYAEVQYEVHADCSDKSNPWEWISDSYIPRRIEGDIPTSGISLQFNLEPLFQYNVGITSQRISADSVQLRVQTVGKYFEVSIETAKQQLEAAHMLMRKEFLELITDKAREDWGFNANN